MVRPSVVGYGACDEDISAVALLDNGIIQSVQLFGSRMLPGGLLSCWELENDAGYEKLVQFKYAVKAKPVVIAVLMSSVSDH